MPTAITDSPEDALERLQLLLRLARAAGAEAADALFVVSRGLSQSVRLGKPEILEREENREVGLRVLIGRQQAAVASKDLSPRALQELAERAVAMARVVPEDPWCGLAGPGEVAKSWPALDLEDLVEPTPESLLERALAADAAAMAVPGISNSDGAQAGWGSSFIALAATNGFAGHYARSSHSHSASVIAGSDHGMERDYDFSVAVHAAGLEPAETVGRRAGERTVRRLNPRKVPTAKMTVVFEPRVASSLIGHLLGAINGVSVARGTSFLKDRLGQAVFRPGIEIREEARRLRGHRSRPFDAEGLATGDRALVADGQLQTWVLDLATARQLGLASTGNASRGTAGPPSPAVSNISLSPGRDSPETLIGAIERGLYVTELMGMGVNGVTGDYSRGAAGFLIEKGALAQPVSEVTIAGNLKEMFRQLTPASDLVLRTGMDAPTLAVEGMTVAGQ
jgi:PmbA protein